MRIITIYNNGDSMAKKYIEDFNSLSKLSQMVVRKHPWGYVGAGVRGGRGDGKTTFCMHIGREVYQYLDGISRDDAWEKLLGIGNYSKQNPHILFDLYDVVKALEPLDNIDFKNILEWQVDNTIPFKMWDDAGMHGGKYKFFTDVKMVEALQGEVDTIRFILTGFATTSPELSSILKFMQEYKDNLIVSIKKQSPGATKYSLVAEVNRYVVDRHGSYRNRLDWKNKFCCYVDIWDYAEYSRMKAHAIIRNRNRLKKILGIAEKQQPDKSKDSIMDEMGVPNEFKDVIINE